MNVLQKTNGLQLDSIVAHVKKEPKTIILTSFVSIVDKFVTKIVILFKINVPAKEKEKLTKILDQ
jgi:hypothetical protein